MTLQLHEPDGQGGLQPVTDPEPDWRDQLRSTRWGTGLRGDRLPKNSNPEMNPTTRFMSVLFWLGLGVLTFLIIAVGYGIGFWSPAIGT